MRFSTRWLAAVAVFICSGTGLVAEDDEKNPPQFNGLKYRHLGPAAGGRTTRSCGVPGDPLTYYVAAASGGVWKSSDGGMTFMPIFDDQPTQSVGSIAVAESDPNVIYVGSGEANIRGNVVPGNGIYKSVDAGKTWKHVWKQIGQIGTIAIHPKDANIAYAACLGHAFGPNPERGIYRTVDGGSSWQRVLFKDNDSGASDVAIDPNNPRVVFAGLWQTRRRPWEMTSGGPGSGLYVSRDGGDTWDLLGPDAPKKKRDKKPEGAGNGLPAGPWGKVGVAIAASDSMRVYAIIEAEKGGLFRSDDGGESWDLANDERVIRQRAWYYSTLTVDPKNPDVVWAPQVPLLKSIDGGKSFKDIKGSHHGDYHDLWIDSKNPRRMINSNDGGVDISTDGGKTWFAPNLPIAQFYHVHADNSTPYRVMGCMQDMGTASGPSRSIHGEGILPSDWHSVGGGEAGYAVPDPSDPNIVYAGEYGGYISRYDHRTRQSRHVGVYPFDPSGFGAEALKYRFQWTSPILVSKHEPKTVYHASNVLFRSTNGGQSWEKVSGDLTRNDRNKQKWTGGPITGDNTGVEFYCTIFAIAESPINKKVMWAGSDDGLVHVSRDQSYTWKNVTANIPDLPDWGTVSCIEASPHAEGTAFVVVDNHRMDDSKPHMWKTTDFGETWVRITEGIPVGEFTRVVREDPKIKGLLYCGTDHGIWFSNDAGASWEALKMNLPAVPVSDLVVKDDDLVVSTIGRSLWILDDLTPIRQWRTPLGNKFGHVFPTKPANFWAYASTVANQDPSAMGENPPNGGVITYHLKDQAKLPITIEIFNEKKVRVAKLEGKPIKKEEKKDDDDPESDKRVEIPAQAGMNRFVWDLSHEGAEIIPKAQLDAGNPKSGPAVAPGIYTVKLKVDGKELTTTLEVKLDPRMTEPRGTSLSKKPPEKLAIAPRVATLEEVSRLEKAAWIFRQNALDLLIEEAKEQEAFALRLRDDVTRLTGAVLELRNVQKQLKLQQDLFGKDDKARAYVKQLKGLSLKLDELEEKFHNPKAKVSYDILAMKGGAKLYSQLSSLLSFAADGNGPPTEGMKTLAGELETELNGLLADYDRIKTEEITKLNELAQKRKAPMIWVPSPKK